MGRRTARGARVRARLTLGEPQPDRAVLGDDDRPDRASEGGGEPADADRRQPGPRGHPLPASSARPRLPPPDASPPQAPQGARRDRDSATVTALYSSRLSVT